jgi:thiol-disulfide isomerase/thioredoxin
MLERLFLTLLLLAVGLVVYLLFNRYHVRRVLALSHGDPLLEHLRPGIPAILYFTTPTCAPCRTQQIPALQRLQADMGETVQIVTVDATENPDDANRWGVFSAPTTFVLDASRHTRAVNHGVADDRKLKRQLLEAVTIH